MTIKQQAKGAVIAGIVLGVVSAFAAAEYIALRLKMLLTSRCETPGCSRDWFDSYWGRLYCRVHHPQYEVPIGTVVERRIPWKDDEVGEP